MPFLRIKNTKSLYLKAGGVIVFLVLFSVIGLFLHHILVQAAVQISASLGTLPGDGRQIVRTSGGTLYVFVNNSGTCRMFSSSNGASWTEQDSAHHPSCSSGTGVGIAIDSTDLINLVYIDSASAFIVRYNTFNTSTNLYGTAEAAVTSGGSTSDNNPQVAVDSNNKPHVGYANFNAFGGVIGYTNKVSGSWISPTVSLSAGNIDTPSFSIAIDKDNFPEVAALIDDTGVSNAIDAEVWVGASNNPTTAGNFTQKVLDASINNTANTRGISLSVDSSGNTWVSYVDSTNTNNINVIEHVYGNAWSSWQTAATDSKQGKQPSIVAKGTTAYVFYQRSSDNHIVYDSYNGSTWGGEVNLETGTYQGVHARWSYLNNNQNSNADYIFSDGTNVFWNNLSLATPPTKIVFSNTAVNATAGTCNTLTVQLQDSGNTVQNPSSTTNVQVSSNSPVGQFTTDNTCATGLSSTATLTYTTSQNSKTIYYLDTRKSPTTWTLTAHKTSGTDTLTDGTQAATITAGTTSRLVVTFPGQTFTDGVGNSGTVTSQTSNSSFTITTISATDNYFNVNTSYSGAKTLSYSGPSNAPDSTPPSYTTSVSFTSGQSTTTLTTTLMKAETTTITVQDAGTLGYASSSITVNPGAVSASITSITVNGGSSTSVAVNSNVDVLIVIKDAKANPISNQSASTITFSGGTPTTGTFSFTHPITNTNSSGVTEPYLQWSTTGTKTINLTISGNLMASHPTVTVSAATVDTSIQGGTKIKGGTRIQ